MLYAHRQDMIPQSQNLLDHLNSVSAMGWECVHFIATGAKDSRLSTAPPIPAWQILLRRPMWAESVEVSAKYSVGQDLAKVLTDIVDNTEDIELPGKVRHLISILRGNGMKQAVDAEGLTVGTAPEGN